jgi:RecG-like helicase
MAFSFSKEKKYLLTGLLAGFIICFVFIGNWISLNPATPAFSFSADRLYKEYRKDESKANNKYLNEIVQVKGKVDQVYRRNQNEVKVILRGKDKNFGISCTIKDLAAQIDKPLKQGAEIVVKGNCCGFDTDVLLTNCEIVEIL